MNRRKSEPGGQTLMHESEPGGQTLRNKLNEYGESDFYAFHMPGHKRNVEQFGEELPYAIDITEIDGFDDLHHAEGILREAQELAARVYHADETHFLINGSTCGILSAILGCTRKGEKILVARNCHKSIYHAMYLNELEPVYLYPEFCSELELNGEVSVRDVEQAFTANPDIRAVMIVSPTYDGVVSDVEGIADVAHAHGVPLIVDEAHGAHFGFDAYFPKNANELGADVVIHSLHKTLPALTQTALLHMNGALVNRKRVKRYLDMLQTSSPSYVLMASIDDCIHLLADDVKRDEMFGVYVALLQDARERLGDLKCLRMLQTEHFDPSKIVISVKHVVGYTSRMLYQELLEKYHLQMEMVAGSYVLAMTTVGDTWEGMGRLVCALLEIDERLSQGDRPLGAKVSQGDRSSGVESEPGGQTLRSPQAEIVMSIARAMDLKLDGETTSQEFRDGIGCISTEFAYLYPPGTPILVPGERVTEAVVEVLEGYQEMGFSLEGLEKEGRVEVWMHG